MGKNRERRESLVYHAKPRPGKIDVIPTKKKNSQRGQKSLKKLTRVRPTTRYHVIFTNSAPLGRVGQ